MRKTSHWLYKNELFNPTLEEMLESGDIGFVYKITNTINNKQYIGKKLCVTTYKRPPLKGRKNKRHVKKFTDWQTYRSSSKYVNADIELLGIENFKFEIITFHSMKSELNYSELVYQIYADVLNTTQNERLYYNENIETKYYHSDKFNDKRKMDLKIYQDLLK